MAALVQIYPQQTGTVSILQARPSSASAMFPPQGQQAPYATQKNQRHNVYGPGNVVANAPVLYRSATAPIQPYAFTSTPSLNTWQPLQQQQNLQNSSFRSPSTAPSVPRMQSYDSQSNLANMQRQTANPSISAARYTTGTRDDLALSGQGVRRVAAVPRAQSTYLTGSPPQLPAAPATPARPSPERYRRGAGVASVTSGAGGAGSTGQIQQKQAAYSTSGMPSGSGMVSIGHLYSSSGGSNISLPDQQRAVPRSQMQIQLGGDARRNSFHDAILSGVAADDIQVHYQHASDDVKQFRRRSMPTLNVPEGLVSLATNSSATDDQSRAPRSPDKSKQRAAASLRPLAMHNKEGSTESAVSTFSSSSRPSSTSRNANVPAFSTGNPATLIAADTNNNDKTRDTAILVNIPPRVSSDATNRLGTQTPLSQSTVMDGAHKAEQKSVGGTASAANNASANNTASLPHAAADPTSPRTTGIPNPLESPAMRHLSAINQKGGKLRSKTSKLRRAFSFGSVADFHKVEAVPTDEDAHVDVSDKSQNESSSRELYDAEQARIAQQQEAGGIGNSIYVNAKIFSGSTDNLSISSTASSASIMIRKMGRGMKKSTRSLVGLFRPKSVVDVPAADEGLPQPSSTPSSSFAAETALSMVTVEAERERVNVNLDLHSQTAGGTGFPRLERNSIDASRASLVSERLGSSGTDNSAHRKSTIEGDKERAEVLAAVRKGILKNTSGNSSPSQSNSMIDLHKRPVFSDSPVSSAPSTPNDDMQGHKRSSSMALGGEDYFVSALRLRQDSKSGSSTPQGSMRRSTTFSPRIVFHDTWPSQEYDRRGDIATCNRLTPMLAQQIKEELNSFKMEMEVHENSKIYTQFF